METFTIGLGNHWWVRAFGRNPLVRGSDRVEAIVMMVAVMVTALAVPIAGAIGTSVHDQRTRLYAEETQTRRQVVATATEDATIVPQMGGVGFATEAVWTDSGIVHNDTIAWPGPAKIGDQQPIWVNSTGEVVGQPSSPSRADTEAVVTALTMWLLVAGASATLVCVVRYRFDRRRYAEWDREIAAFDDNNGRRNHQS